MKKKLLLMLLFVGISACAQAQTTSFINIRPKKKVANFVLPEKLTITKKIYANGIVKRSNGHIFVPGPASNILVVDLVCFSTDAVQIGPVLAPHNPSPHFDGSINSLACLARLYKPKDKKHPFVIMYPSGAIRKLPYTECHSDGFIDGLAVVSDGTGYYLIDHYGRVKAKDFERIGPLREGRRAVRKKGKWGFVDSECKVVIEPKYFEVGVFSDQVAWVKKENFLSEPCLINPFGGELHFKTPLSGTITKAYDFVDGEALVMLEKSDGNYVEQIINKSGLPLVIGQELGEIWLTEFDNKHAEYFFTIKDDEGFVKYSCSTKGNVVNGLSSFRRGDAFTWDGSDAYKSWHPTSVQCFVDVDADGDFYTEDHVVWRCDNPSEDLFFFKDEHDGIAMWEYKHENFISSSIHQSEKTELGGSFPNIVQIASPDECPSRIIPSAAVIGTARIPRDNKGSDDRSADLGTITPPGIMNLSDDYTSFSAAIKNTLTLCITGDGTVVTSANGTTISNGSVVEGGTQVTIVCTPAEDSEVSTVKLNGLDIGTEVNGTVHTITFQMPNVPSVVSIEFGVHDHSVPVTM